MIGMGVVFPPYRRLLHEPVKLRCISLMSIDKNQRPPSVDRIATAVSVHGFSQKLSTKAARQAIALARTSGEMQVTKIIEVAVCLAKDLDQSQPQRVINLSGVILHTGLGRARLLVQSPHLTDHTAVEFDMETSSRGIDKTMSKIF